MKPHHKAHHGQLWYKNSTRTTNTPNKSFLTGIFRDNVHIPKSMLKRKQVETCVFEACIPFTDSLPVEKKKKTKGKILWRRMHSYQPFYTTVSTPISLGVSMRGVMPLLRSSSNSRSWPMKLRLGEMIGLRIFTNL